MLHEILEKLTFADVNDSDLKAIISEKLSDYKYDQIWLAAVDKMIKDLITMPLSLSEAQFSLKYDTGERLPKEVEFYFPLQGITAEKIINVLENSGQLKNNIVSIDDLYREMNFPLTRGYVKGFIDLVFEHEGRFYLADWKSNYLGETYLHYAPASLKNAMFRSSYVLQYLLYTVALIKYLRRRSEKFQLRKTFRRSLLHLPARFKRRNGEGKRDLL